jgi:uroporphyrin-III C-methyltransferase/precorrin-2 dehydrogenase/sirohydrochlorin ferrochelatase
VRSLPLFHRVTGQPVIVLGEGPAAEAKRRLVERAGGLIESNAQAGIDRGARLAFVALDDQVAAEAEAVRLRCAGLLVNVVDRPELCDFTTPSVLDRDPVLVAIGTDGASAGLAKHLRLRLEALLPDTIGRLAGALSASRDAIRARWTDAADRRRALDAALGEGGALDPLRGSGPQEVAGWLGDGNDFPPARRVEFTAPADPAELTLRQLQWLGAAETIVFDPAVSPEVLNRARADAERLAMDADEPVVRPGLTVVLRTAEPAR